ncbi:MAG: hypothetical protein KDI30_05105, partial [Pseudomonadales bacterium]|nr:hypothetical protein [Pseudomonadales bacterium]
MREIEASLGFARPADVLPDTERPGLLRVKTMPMDPYSDIRELLDCQTCRIRDTAGAHKLNLETMGFDRIDLTADPRLQATLEKVRVAGELDDADVKAIRRGFLRRTFRLENGKRLRFLYVAPEGFIMRKAGPNGLKISTPEQMTEKNNHDGALAVHGDQDVKGTPVKQILKG